MCVLLRSEKLGVPSEGGRAIEGGRVAIESFTDDLEIDPAMFCYGRIASYLTNAWR
jgi:hypothetical protein